LLLAAKYIVIAFFVHDGFPGGELILHAVEAGNRGEIARILRNEELRVRERKPLKRTILHESWEWEAGRVEITTGEAEYSGWDARLKRQGVESSLISGGHNDKFARVVWEKSAAK